MSPLAGETSQKNDPSTAPDPVIESICSKIQKIDFLMEQRAIKHVNNCLHTNIYFYLETFGGQSFSLDLNVVHFFNNSVN